MIRAAGLGVAYHAKPKVAAEADARIDHNDLTALLFAQGYRASGVRDMRMETERLILRPWERRATSNPSRRSTPTPR